MSCFDTLRVICPACGLKTGLQSKAGACDLATYSLEDAPLVIVADLAEGVHACEHCRSGMIVEVQHVASVRRVA